MQRYDAGFSDIMVPCDTGEWVRWEDIQGLLALERDVDALRRRLFGMKSPEEVRDAALDA